MLTDWWAAIVPHLNRRKASCGLSPASLLPSSTTSELPLLNPCSFSLSALFLFPRTLLFRFRRYPPFACALISCLFPPLCKSDFISFSLSHVLLSRPSPSLAFPPPCICHSHSPSLFISWLYVSVDPGLECHERLGRSHSLCLHLLAWSPISLYQHCHPFHYSVPFMSPSLSLSPVLLCHHLGVPVNPSSLITFPTSNPRAHSVDDLWWKACLRFKAKFPHQS